MSDDIDGFYTNMPAERKYKSIKDETIYIIGPWRSHLITSSSAGAKMRCLVMLGLAALKLPKRSV